MSFSSGLPEPVYVFIFKLLDSKDVVNCSRVCKHWRKMAADNLLWKHLLKRDFKLKLTLPAALPDWKEEYVRLMDTPPAVLRQTLDEHEDEVLHASFSHDGNQVASCSKDRKVIVWNINPVSGQFTEHFRKDMGAFSWLQTWAAQFSPSDTRLMVAGVVNEVGGELAIFKTGRGGDEQYVYLCRVVNDPYDVMGCWLSDNYFLSGTMSADFFVNLEASIWLCQPPEHPGQEEQLQTPQLNLDCYKGLLFKFRNSAGNFNVRYVQSFSRAHFSPEDDAAINWTPVKSERRREEDINPLEQVLQEEEERLMNESRLCAVFLCGDKTSIPHQLGFQRLTRHSLRFPPVLKTPEKVLDFHGHVIGLSVSPDSSLLFVNVRSWPENAVPQQDQPPPIATEIELHVVDLRTLEHTGVVMTGHRGYTPTEKAFYLYVDISDDFVGSGSENSLGYLWDRKYGTRVATLPHSLCVNCVAICPKPELQLCVTASDDGTIKVWESRKRARERVRQQQQQQ